MSLPGWGEWVEIKKLPIIMLLYITSLPGWGEWVEMDLDTASAVGYAVSPRMGRVG